uniref:Uncharacterized protein n=1 Tax=Setaria italica TaxID=4555 RepID=K3ZZQ2_SETIT
MQSIRRELQRRRPKHLAPKSSVAMKPSAPPPPRESARCTGREPRPLPPRLEVSSSTASKSPPGSAATHAPRPRRRSSPRPTVFSPSTPLPASCAPSSGGSACLSTLGADEHLRPGTEVGVRTRTTTLKTGEALVLWLRAMIVSPIHGGYEVVYDGNWPPGDPYGTVQVPRRHIRMRHQPERLRHHRHRGRRAEEGDASPAEADHGGEEPAPHPPRPLAGDGTPGPG